MRRQRSNADCSSPQNDTHPVPAGRPAPMLGQHTDGVLSDMGYSEDEIAALRAAGVIQ